MFRRHLQCLVVLTSFSLGALVSQAAVTVDPLSTGATDVRAGNNYPGNLLINPVTDPISVVFLQIGYASAGSLRVDNGSIINSQTTYVASEPNSVGNLLITGNTTRLISSYDIRVGLRGLGTMNITDGAVVESDQGWVGSGAYSQQGDGTVNVSGAGSRWDNGSVFFTVGEDGGAKGLLSINSGAVVNLNTSQQIFDNDDFSSDVISSNGSIRIDGTGSLLQKTGAFGVRLGDLWQYGLEVTNGGLLDIDGDLLIREYDSPTSRVLLNNGSIETHTLWFNPDRLTGTGVINTTGLVMDGDLTFDAALGPQRQIVLQDLPGQNVTINLDHTQEGSLGVGHQGEGYLTVSEGRQLTTKLSGVLGQNEGSVGTALITGADTNWTAVGGFVVGERGQGILRIEQGATVETDADVFIGRSEGSTGSRIEFDGGTLRANTLFTTGNDLFGTGTINTRGIVVDTDIVFDQSSDPQQQLVFDDLPGQNVTVNLALGGGTLGAGYRGHGSVTVAGGQSIYADKVVLGYGRGGRGEGLVTGVGSELVAPTIMVGSTNSQADGRLEIVAGGKVGGGQLIVHRFGEIVVQDTGSLFDINQLQAYHGSSIKILAGARGQGRVYINDGSLLRVHGLGSKYVADQIRIAQSLLTIEDQAVVEVGGGGLGLDSGVVSINGGTLDLKGGSISTGQYGSHLILADGTLKNVRTLTGDLQQSGGEFVVSSTPAKKTVIDGDYFMSGDSTLRLILDQQPIMNLDVMRVQGLVVLGGTLEVEWGSGFAPTLGSSYPLFGDPQTIAGNFEQVKLPEINSDLRWALVDEIANYERRLLLTVVSTGDFDLDGDVDGRDLLVWQRNPSVGDLADWQNNYGSSSLTASSVAVPEPASILLLVTLSVVALGRRSRVA